MTIIDEEEFLLILKLKDLKKQYRTEYQDLRDLRAEIQYCQHLVDQCRHRLLTGAPLGRLAGHPRSREAQGRITSWLLEGAPELFSDRGRSRVGASEECFQDSVGRRWRWERGRPWCS